MKYQNHCNRATDGIGGNKTIKCLFLGWNPKVTVITLMMGQILFQSCYYWQGTVMHTTNNWIAPLNQLGWWSIMWVIHLVLPNSNELHSEAFFPQFRQHFILSSKYALALGILWSLERLYLCEQACALWGCSVHWRPFHTPGKEKFWAFPRG